MCDLRLRRYCALTAVSRSHSGTQLWRDRQHAANNWHWALSRGRPAMLNVRFRDRATDRPTPVLGRQQPNYLAVGNVSFGRSIIRKLPFCFRPATTTWRPWLPLGRAAQLRQSRHPIPQGRHEYRRTDPVKPRGGRPSRRHCADRVHRWLLRLTISSDCGQGHENMARP